MSLLAQLVAKREGFGIPGALPTRNSNPGDLRHAPGETHAAGDPNGIGSFDSVAAGWAALEMQLRLYAQRGLTVGQMVALYAPPGDHNDTQGYLDFVCEGLGCTPDTLVSNALVIQGAMPT